MTADIGEAWRQPEAITSVSDVPAVLRRLRQTFESGHTKPLSWRIDQLRAIENMLKHREADLVEALAADLGRSPFEAWFGDVAAPTADSAYARKHLHRWARSRRARVPLKYRPGRAWYQYEPLGVTLIISPWNFPVYLTLGPLIPAIAAGNCAVLKPSEHTPTVARVLREAVAAHVDESAVAVVEGDGEVTQELLGAGFDHVFFTGSADVARHVLAGAAPTLAPVTLELGGKSPVIIAEDADLKVAARRVAWAKLLNSGQTCVAPDYALVVAGVRDRFVDELILAVRSFYGSGTPRMPIVNARHAARVGALLDTGGGRTVLGGSYDVAAASVDVTVIVDPVVDSALMTEEIFGPVLPVVSVDSVDAAVEFVRSRPKPLAAYLFTSSAAHERSVLERLPSGGVTINHLMLHGLVNELPFGGVGRSGMGSYHGEFGFWTFSHRKSVLRKPTRPDPSLMYPPYTKIKQRLFRALM